MQLDYENKSTRSANPQARFTTPVTILVYLNGLAGLALFLPGLPSILDRDYFSLMMVGAGLTTLYVVFGCLSRTPPKYVHAMLFLTIALAVELVLAKTTNTQVEAIENHFGKVLSNLVGTKTYLVKYEWYAYARDASLATIFLSAILWLYLAVAILRRPRPNPDH